MVRLEAVGAFAGEGRERASSPIVISMLEREGWVSTWKK